MVGESGASVLAVLTRAPSAGGKTRLFAGLGLTPDPALLGALLLDTLEGAATPGVTRVAAVTPPGAVAELEAMLPPEVRVVTQPDGDLGTRMDGVLAGLFAAGAGRVALIGSDLPEITPGLVAGAFAALAEDADRLVLGPSIDGGYYLIAATRVPPVFDGIPWGAATVLEDTLAAAGRARWPVHLLPPEADVDTPDDLRRATAARPASRTAQWVRTRGGRVGT